MTSGVIRSKVISLEGANASLEFRRIVDYHYPFAHLFTYPFTHVSMY